MSYWITRFSRGKLSKNFSSIGEVRGIIGNKEGILVAHILLFIYSKSNDPINHWSTEIGNFIFIPKISSLSKNFVKNLDYSELFPHYLGGDISNDQKNKAINKIKEEDKSKLFLIDYLDYDNPLTRRILMDLSDELNNLKNKNRRALNRVDRDDLYKILYNLRSKYLNEITN